MLFRIRIKQLAVALLLSALSLDLAAQSVDAGSNQPAAAAGESKTPSSVEKKYAQAVEYYNEGRHAEALTLFEQIWFSSGAFKETRKYLDLLKAPGQDKANATEELVILPGLSSGKPAQGGQIGGPVSGGLSSAERLSRLMIDARRAFDDGDLEAAGGKYSEALKLDSSNPEAKKYLQDIDRLKGSASFSPAATGGELISKESAAPATAQPASANSESPSKPSGETKIVAKEDAAAKPSEVAVPAPAPSTAKGVQQMASTDVTRSSKKIEMAFGQNVEKVVADGGKEAVQAFGTPAIARLKNLADAAAAATKENAAPEASPDKADKKVSEKPVVAQAPEVEEEEAPVVSSLPAASKAVESAVVGQKDEKSATEQLASESSLALPGIQDIAPVAEQESKKAAPASDQKAEKPDVEKRPAEAAKVPEKKEKETASPKDATEKKSEAVAEEAKAEPKNGERSAWSVLANPVVEPKAADAKVAGDSKDATKSGDTSKGKKADEAKAVTNASGEATKDKNEEVDIKALFEKTLKETADKVSPKPSNLPDLPSSKLTTPETAASASARQIASEEARNVGSPGTELEFAL